MSSRPGRADPFSVRKVVQAAAGDRLYVNDAGRLILRLGRFGSGAPNIRANRAAVEAAEEQGLIAFDPETNRYSATDAGRAHVDRSTVNS